MRALAPLLFIATILMGAGCFQPQVVSDPAAGKAEALHVLQAEPNEAPDVTVPSIEVLPAADLTDRTVAALAPADIMPTTVTRWAKTSAATTLWSGPDASAAAFTDLPAASFLKLIVGGLETPGRLAVYYVGDGLLRRPGNGWVDAAAYGIEIPDGQLPWRSAPAR